MDDDEDERDYDLADLREEDVLEQLQELHRQLAEKRSDDDGGRAPAEKRSGLLAPERKLIVCAVRRPVHLEKPFGEAAYAYEPSRSGLSAAVESLEKSGVRCRWVAWPGCFVEKTSREGVRARLEDEFNCRPVFLDRDIEDLFYARFCHGVLWPLFHCIPATVGDKVGEKGGLVGTRATDQYEAYLSVNQQYLEALAAEYQEGDLVVVHDYELMLLPAMIRSRFPEAACGFFCNCPFPSSEFYRMLPARDALLRGVLGADLISFNHFDYVRHFLNACMRVLGLESAPSRLEYHGRLVTVSICPAGIAPDVWEPGEANGLAGARLRGPDDARRIILSLDALDASKGIPQRLLALEALLERRPEWRGRAVLVLAARDRDRRVDAPLRRAVDGLVGHVNGRFGRADYVPVHYVKRTLDENEVKALYAAADVALICSVREGINLWAMEFVAAQSARLEDRAPGVLVYSEFAGCASSFQGGALVVNPYDADGVADALHAALAMPANARRVRHHALARYVHTYTADLWAARLVRELRLARDRTSEHTRLLPLDVARLRSSYERSRRRLVVLEYDGALAPHASLPQLAQPSPVLVATLKALCGDGRNTVYVLSGRRRDDLDAWLGEAAPRLGLVAEAGYWVKRAPRLPTAASGTALDDAVCPTPPPERAGSLEDRPEAPPTSFRSDLARELAFPSTPGSQRDDVSEDVTASPAASQTPGPAAADDAEDEPRGWEAPRRTVDLTWMDEVRPILESFTRQTPGSALEATDARLCWHFRDADPDFGEAQAKNLQLHLEAVVEHRPVRVRTSAQKQAVTVQPARVSPGRALRAAVGDVEQYDLVLAIGDERYARPSGTRRGDVRFG